MSQIILVVDDDSDTLTLIGITLQRRNFEILKAQGGQQALDLLKHEKPDLVVLDVMMPEMDGYEVCRRIKADPRTAYLPVIMLTAKAQTASQLEGFRSGAADYITKPVHPQELVARIQSVLERARSAQAQRGARVISISGAKGGVGATTLAVNVALALAAETNTILADFEPGGTAALHLGLVPSQGLGTLLEHEAADIDRASVEAVLAQHPSGLRLLSGADEPLDPDRALVILNHLASLCEACVLDLGWSVSAAGRAIAIKHNWKSHVQLIHEGTRIGFSILECRVDRQHGQTAIAIVAIHDIQCRHLNPTGRTPRGPQIDHHDFAAQIGQLEQVIIEIGE